jgi:hypothetical protein
VYRPELSVAIVRTRFLLVSVIVTCALTIAALLASDTVPLTWATAVAWAFRMDCEPEKRKTDVSKDKLANVDRDVYVID